MKFLTLSQVTGSREDDLEIMQETTTLVIVNAEHIRSFGPRKHNKPGTLIIFANSSMFSVTEPYDEVKRQVTLPPSRQRLAPAPDQSPE